MFFAAANAASRSSDSFLAVSASFFCGGLEPNDFFDRSSNLVALSAASSAFVTLSNASLSLFASADFAPFMAFTIASLCSLIRLSKYSCPVTAVSASAKALFIASVVDDSNQSVNSLTDLSEAVPFFSASSNGVALAVHSSLLVPMVSHH